jgi:hypothetical protein
MKPNMSCPTRKQEKTCIKLGKPPSIVVSSMLVIDKNNKIIGILGYQFQKKCSEARPQRIYMLLLISDKKQPFK